MPPRLKHWPWWLLAGHIAAFWPVWWLHAQRIAEGIDEPWGLLAMGAAAAVVGWMVRLPPPTAAPRSWNWTLAAASALLLAYIALGRLTPLVGGILAATTLALLLSRLAAGRLMHWPLWGLLLLSLPLSSALQFYLGYPVRAATAACTAWLLHLIGFAAERSGAVLSFAGKSVWVDAPCSGVKMLWSGMFLAMLLAAVHRLGNRRAALAGAAALAAIFVGNILRSTSLFFVEIGGHLVLPAWFHNAVGIAAFILTAVLIAASAHLVARRRPAAPTTVKPADAPVPARFLLVLHLSLLAAAAPAPLALGRGAPATPTGHFAGWPASFESLALVPEPLTDRERLYLTDFPGRIAKFSDGRRQIIIRWVSTPTRKLHLSMECLRGVGYRITPRPGLLDAQGRPWSRFLAERGAERLLISERIHDDHGHSWPDVSAWYWAALLHRTRSPWWALTVVEAAP